ncbi:hypothetical protein [Corynebacterium minutissimum]|uniref:hypothetical protein n=1 Tax=Corynebacterium minutissimum TaxID=38301 RepID=UPI001EF1B3EC|nr:hypothetical protein [Corynebacterium minutissimum]MCG7239600.1 hypothetical protein [Corynebacterium minutissimum]
MPPNFEFFDSVPPVRGRSYIDSDRAQDTIDALVEFPNRWACVPVTFLYPDLEGTPEQKLKSRARSLAGRLQRRDLKPFNDYRIEAKSRDTNVYMRVVMSRREMREAGYDLED